MTNPEPERWSRAPLDPRAAFADALRREGSMAEAEIENALSKTGRVGAGASEAEGEDRAARAAHAAVAPLVADGSIRQASGIMLEIVGTDLTEEEASAAAETVHQACGPDTEILFWVLHDEKMAGTIKVAVFAIGFDE